MSKRSHKATKKQTVVPVSENKTETTPTAQSWSRQSEQTPVVKEKSVTDFDRTTVLNTFSTTKVKDVSSMDMLKILSVRGEQNNNPTLRFKTLELMRMLAGEPFPRNTRARGRNFNRNRRHNRNNQFHQSSERDDYHVMPNNQRNTHQ